MKKLTLLILLANFAFAGELFENWTAKNETKFYYFVGLQALDVASTRYAINRGGTEMNPLLGKNPSTEKLLLSKAVMVPLMYGLLSLQDNESRSTVLNWTNIFYVGVVGNNVMVGAKIKF